jgi:hypothetical protein
MPRPCTDTWTHTHIHIHAHPYTHIYTHTGAIMDHEEKKSDYSLAIYHQYLASGLIHKTCSLNIY